MLHGAGMFTYIETPNITQWNVGKYSSIHGASGIVFNSVLIVFDSVLIVFNSV